MRLIVGLGNPGEKYKQTLHNIGFAAIDYFAERRSLSSWTEKFKGEILMGSYEGRKFVLLKPLTYMNLSGQAVQSCLNFYRIALQDVLVISYDVDLAPGTIRYRLSGGHGGHNGLRNIIEQCGSNDFHRLRIGVGRSTNQNVSTADYVLGKPTLEIQELMQEAVVKASGYLLDFVLEKQIQIQD